jgi:hypothetical protein
VAVVDRPAGRPRLGPGGASSGELLLLSAGGLRTGSR